MKTNHAWTHWALIAYEEIYHIEFLNFVGCHYDTKAIINSLKSKLASAKLELDQAGSIEELVTIIDKYEKIIKAHFAEAYENGRKSNFMNEQGGLI